MFENVRKKCIYKSYIFNIYESKYGSESASMKKIEKQNDPN